MNKGEEDSCKGGKRIMSHLKDKNSTVTVVFLLRNTLRSQQATVKQGAPKTKRLLQL